MTDNQATTETATKSTAGGTFRQIKVTMAVIMTMILMGYGAVASWANDIPLDFIIGVNVMVVIIIAMSLRHLILYGVLALQHSHNHKPGNRPQPDEDVQ